jgi:hypothetical protein
MDVARKDRRVEVKLKPGRKPLPEGQLSEAATATRKRISEVAMNLALEGTWPSPIAVERADPKLSAGNVRHHLRSLDQARATWVAANGPHTHWRAPAAHDAAAPGARGEDGEAEIETSRDGEEVAAEPHPEGDAQSRTATTTPGEAEAIEKPVSVEGGLTASGRETKLMEALALEGRRILRLEEDVKDRNARIAALEEIVANLKELNRRLMLRLRKDLPRFEDDDGPPPV